MPIEMNREEEFKKSLNEILDSKEFTFNEVNLGRSPWSD